MNSLENQLNDFIVKQTNKDDCITAKEFKEIFLLGFAKQMQVDVEQFFEFQLEDVGNGNCNIIARLKKDNETTCHILNEFFLKKNLNQIKQLFGVPDIPEICTVDEGVIEL